MQQNKCLCQYVKKSNCSNSSAVGRRLGSTYNNKWIDHLYTRTKEFINTLIVVTSQLHAVVTSMNVLNLMENQWCVIFKRMLWFKYTVHVNCANSNGSTIHFYTLLRLLEANRTYWLWVTVQRISSWSRLQLKTKAKWLVAFTLYAISA